MFLVFISMFGVLVFIINSFRDIYEFHYVNIVVFICCVFIPFILILCLKFKYKKQVLISIFAFNLLVIISFCCYSYYTFSTLMVSDDLNTNYNHDYDYSSIDTDKYLPFSKESDIARLDRSASVKFTDNLPRVDGAAAVFPLYSAFVNALYPDSVKLGDGVFFYNNTVDGYRALADRETDVFFGAYPSSSQIEYARENGVEFSYTPIGKEGFVFFVNKDNPVNNLTTLEVQKIYSQELTNWHKVGGKFSRIIPFQRNEGSGSQSMLERFMGNKKIMDPPVTLINDMMGIIKVVSDYNNYKNAIGFSFRYYTEDLVNNENVKLLSIDGVSPTLENISSDKYPITTKLYAVTRRGEHTFNVDKLLDWILSSEGQELVYKTGYAKIK